MLGNGLRYECWRVVNVTRRFVEIKARRRHGVEASREEEYTAREAAWFYEGSREMGPTTVNVVRGEY